MNPLACFCQRHLEQESCLKGLLCFDWLLSELIVKIDCLEMQQTHTIGRCFYGKDAMILKISIDRLKLKGSFNFRLT